MVQCKYGLPACQRWRWINEGVLRAPEPALSAVEGFRVAEGDNLGHQAYHKQSGNNQTFKVGA
jgi:hypothetical protein